MADDQKPGTVPGQPAAPSPSGDNGQPVVQHEDTSKVKLLDDLTPAEADIVKQEQKDAK